MELVGVGAPLMQVDEGKAGITLQSFQSSYRKVT
jgi:hypothetical protein